MAAAFAAQGALAGPVPPCLAPGARIAAFGGLPAPVRIDLIGHFAPGTAPERRIAMTGSLIADAGGDWQATDVISLGRTLPGRRFMIAARSGGRLWVWWQTGGIAMTTHVAVFQSAADRWRLVRHVAGGQGDVCRRLSNGGASVYDQYW